MFTSTARKWARITPLAAGAACALSAVPAIASAAPTPLNSAARSSTRADHALVASARALRACLHAHPSHPAACNAERGAVQHNGHRLARAERHLARLARGGAGARASSISWVQHAPVVTVSGQRLSWSHVGNVETYVLARKVPGQATQYSLVHGVSTTPPPVPGVTVSYAVRTDVNGSEWSSSHSISYPAAKLVAPPAVETTKAPEKVSAPETPAPESPPKETVNNQAAPALTVSGVKLSWNTVAGLSTYVLATKVPGQAEAFTEVTGTSTTPPAVPGKTVQYSVRTAVVGSAWSTEVAITYPAAPKEEKPAPKEEAPAPKETPGTSGTAGWEPGINAGFDTTIEPVNAAHVGAKIARIGFGIGSSIAEIEPVVAAYAAQGVRVEFCAEFLGTMATPAQAKSLANFAKVFGPGGTFWAKRSTPQLAVQTIEFGNETSGTYQYGDSYGSASYMSRGEAYALRIKEASEAIAATGVKVAVLAVSEDETGNWMNAMFKAVPNLGSYIGGWVSHPYGSGWKLKIEDIIKQAAAHGAPASLPIDITEWGISTDNGVCLTQNFGLNPCMTYQQAAETMRSNVAEIRSLIGSRQGLFLMYQLRDHAEPTAGNDLENYFGALSYKSGSKGAYTTAAEELLAS